MSLALDYTNPQLACSLFHLGFVFDHLARFGKETEPQLGLSSFGAWHIIL